VKDRRNVSSEGHREKQSFDDSNFGKNEQDKSTSAPDSAAWSTSPLDVAVCAASRQFKNGKAACRGSGRMLYGMRFTMLFFYVGLVAIIFGHPGQVPAGNLQADEHLAVWRFRRRST
jgi:hypothetical protein